MIRNFLKKSIIFPIVILLTLSVLSSFFLFIPTKKDSPLTNSVNIAKLIEKYSAGDKIVKTIDDEFLTEEQDKKISINDFCNLTGTKYSEDDDYITLKYNGFSANINKKNNYIVTTDGNVVCFEENENNLYPIETIATSLGFEISYLNQETKLTRPYQTKRVIVKANGNFDTCGAIEVLNAFGNTYLLQYETEIDAKNAIENLNNQKEVEYAEANLIVSLDDDLPNEYYQAALSSGTFLSWGGEKLGVDDYKEYLQSAIGENYLDTITVAVLDTGIDTDHPMFAGRINQYSHNFVDTTSGSIPEDDHGHGTHVAGIICDLTYKNVQILALKVLNYKGQGESIHILNAIDYVTNLKNSTLPSLAVINMSLGAGYPVNSTPHNSQKASLQAAYNSGVLPVVSAGNGDDNGIAIDVANACPANISFAITVGAVGLDKNDNYYIGTFSNYGEYVDISAPGISIVSAAHNGTTTTKTGTSMAAPHISAVVALLLSDKIANYNNLTELEEALMFYTVDAGSEGWDPYFGIGIPDLTYAHCDKLLPVEFSNQNTNCSETFELTLSHTNTEANVKILYTTNGETPTVQNSTLYTGPITISRTTTVKAIACTVYEGSITKCSKISQITYQFAFTVDENGFLTEYNGSSADVVVPETVSGIPVIGIANYCFQERTDIKTVTLPATVEYIGIAAFNYCTNLTRVVAPSVWIVDDYSFYGCINFNNLNDVYFPNLEYIYQYAFANCQALTTVNLPTVVLIDESAFAYCTSLVSVNFGNALALGGNAFFNCSFLTSANLPKCQIISTQAFKNCRLSSISFPEVVLLGSGVFGGNLRLSAANLPNVIYIGNSCFTSCPLDTINAENTQIIGRSAFFNCSNLTTANFPNATRIEYAAFANTSLTNINLNSARIIEGVVFQNVPASSISLPSIIKIEAHTFENLSTLTSLTLSHCIEEIEPYAINSCTNCVIRGYRNTVAQTYAIENGYTFSPITVNESHFTYNIVDNKEIHITGYSNSLSTNAVIPDYIEGLPVTTIETEAFKNCLKLNKLQSNTITTIKDGAFEGCANLTTVILPKVTYIGDSAFKNCTLLVNLSIDKVETIGEKAFNGCLSLTSFSFSNSETVIGEKAFGFNEDIKIDYFFIYCYEGSTAEAYAIENEFNYSYIANQLSGFYYNYYTTEGGVTELYIASVSKTTNGEVILPSSYNGYTISAIGQYAFDSCSFITKVFIPSTYTTIEAGAFSSCSLLEEINLENIKYIDDYAFEYCYRLKEANLENTTYLGESVFYYCSNLEIVNIPKLSEIKTQTFYACGKLHTVLGENITYIGEWAFWQTKKLENIDLSEVRNIQAGLCVSFEVMYLPAIEILGDHALNSNNQLTKLVLNKTITSIGTYAIPRIGANTTVYGYKGTVAETYTTTNGIAFEEIKDISIVSDLKISYEFDNISENSNITFKTTGFDATYSWYKNTDQTKYNSHLVLTSNSDTFVVDKFVVDSFFIYCEATDWKGETVTSRITYVVVTSNVYFTVTTTVHGNGRISPEGVVYVKENTAAIFYFLPETGYEIDAVYVDGNNIGKATSQNFPRVTKNHTIEVYFTIIKLSIFVSTNGYGYVSPDGNGSGEIIVDWGEETTFSFTPLEGYKLSYVTVNEVPVSVNLANSSYTFLMPTREYYLVAYFEIISFEITITSTGGNIDPYGKVYVDYGNPLRVYLENTVEDQIVKVLKNGETLIEDARTVKSFLIDEVKESFSIEIVTIPHPYFVTVTTDENGTAESEVIVANYNETATINLIPKAGYKVSKVLLDGEDIDPSNFIQITEICADHEISAEFDLIVYTISFDLGGFGEIVEAENNTATYGENKLYTINSNPLYQIDEVFVNGKKVLLIDGNKIGLENISDDLDIKVTFKKNLSVPIAIIVVVAIAMIVAICLLLYIKRRLKLEHRKKTNLTAMLHTSKKTDIKTIKIKDEFLLDDEDTKKKRKRTTKKS